MSEPRRWTLYRNRDGLWRTWPDPTLRQLDDEGVEVMPVAEHEATLTRRVEKLWVECKDRATEIADLELQLERFQAACRHVVANCYCQPSGQTCDVCQPAMLALAMSVDPSEQAHDA
jgi:hypothetical protein